MHGIIKRPAGRPGWSSTTGLAGPSKTAWAWLPYTVHTHALCQRLWPFINGTPLPKAGVVAARCAAPSALDRSSRCPTQQKAVKPRAFPRPPFSPFPSSRCCCSCRGSLASCGHAMPVSSPKYFFPHSIPHEIWTGRADPSSGRREIATAARGAANLLRTRSNLERDKRLATHPPNGVRADNAVPDRPPTHRGAPRRLLLLSGAAPHASANRGAACLPAPRATTRLLDLLAHVNPTPGAESCHGTSPPLRRNANPTRYLRRGCFPSSLPSIRLLPLARRDVGGVLVNVRTHSSRARSRPLGRTVSRFHPW